MATVRLNAIDSTYASYDWQRDNKVIQTQSTFSTSEVGLIQFESLNIPSPSIITNANVYLYCTTNSGTEKYVWGMNNPTPINGFRFNPNLRANYWTKSTIGSGSGKYVSANLSGYSLGLLKNNMYLAASLMNNSRDIFTGAGGSNKPYIDITYENLNANYKPVCSIKDNRLYYDQTNNPIRWFCAEEVYGNIISKYEVEIINQTTGVKTIHTTAGIKELPSNLVGDTDIYTIRIRATTIYGVIGDWFESYLYKYSTIYSISATSPSGDVLENPTTVRFAWVAKYQEDYELFISKDGKVFNSVDRKTSSNNYADFNLSSYAQGEYHWKVKVFSGSSYYISNSLKFYIATTPTITNLTTQGEYWEKPIIVNWRSEFQTGYEYECYYNNIKVKTGSGTTATTFTIPANAYSGTLPATVRVRVKNVVGGTTLWSDWVERSISLKDITATISNLTITGEHYEKDISLSWQSTDQQQFKIEVLKDNVVVRTYTGTTAEKYIIAANQLTSEEHTFRVWVAYADRFANNTERTVKLKDILPTLKNVSLSGSNVDLPITVSWESTDQQSYIIEVWQGDVKKHEFTGTTAKNHTIPHSTIKIGLTVFKVKVAYKDRWTSYEQVSGTLIETLPSIGVLEPDGVITERDNPTRIWWTSQNQSKWKLVIDGTIEHTGTTEKELIIPAGTLTTGQHNMVLTIWYITSLGVEKSPVTKKSEWIVQGKPPLPTILGDGNYITSRPVIQWDTQDQQGYILDILKNDEIVYSTDWQNGLVTEHKVKEYLGNGTYTVRIKVMNQYSLESYYSSREIVVNATKPQAPSLHGIYMKNHTELSWHSPGDIYTHFYILRNGEVIAKVIGTSYTDYTCFGECIYTVRSITSMDIFQDSNNEYINCEIKEGIMCTVNALDDVIHVGLSQKQYAFNGSIELDGTEVFLSGRELPITVFGEHRSGNYSLSFTSRELFRFLDMCKRRAVFMYRDKRQKLFLTIKDPGYEFDSLGTTYSVAATEVDYNEVIDYG